jgi:superfamily I DNA/RNA helicase
MAQMNYPYAPDGCRPGERVVFNALKRNLPDDYFVWFEPTLFGQRKSARPDFVVLGADIGMVIVEVKDWSTQGIRSANRHTFEIYSGRKVVTRSNPEHQVQSHRYALMDEIERYHDTNPDKYRLLLQKNGRHKGKLAVPISTFVAFPNITRSAWQSSELQLYHMLNEGAVLLRNDLDGHLPERLRSAPVFRASLSKAQVDTLKWMLYPETHVPWSQQRMATLDAEQIGIARIDTFLPAQAKKLSQKPQARLVRGVVGSGKTLILLFRAKFISEQNPNWRVLVLTYNKSLRDYLRQVFEQIGGDPERVEIVNFHKWCRDLLACHGLFQSPQGETSQKGLITRILKEAGSTDFDPQFLVDEFNWIKERLLCSNWDDYLDSQKVRRVGRGRGLGGDERGKRQIIYDLFSQYQERLAKSKICDWADVPVMVLKAIDDGVIERAQYQAVLIDEAQDFAPSWFRVAFAMVKPETNMLFIVGDGAQKIYRRDFTWKELGLGITPRNSHVLRRSYRSTREIIEVAMEVIRDSPTITAELESAGDGIVEPEKEYTRFRHGPLPVLLSFESPEQEYKGVGQEISSLLQQGYLPKNIVILQRHRGGIGELSRALRTCGVACRVVKGDLDIAEPAVKICTLHSAKGLEFDIVFICGLEQFRIDEPVDTQSEDFQQLLDQERKLLYVGMTRARQMLYVTYSGVAPERIVGRLQRKLKEMQPKP